MADSNAGIQKLLEAEEEAAQIVNRARAARVTKLQAADAEAEKEIQQFRLDQDAKFAKEVEGKDDSSDAFVKQLQDKARADVQKMQGDFAKNKAVVAELMLHHVTTVAVTLTDAQRQSMLKFAGQ